MTIFELIKTCDNTVMDAANSEDIREIANVLTGILTHVVDFVDQTDFSPTCYQLEYFCRNKNEQIKAIEAFSNILEEIEEYLYD